MDLFIIQFIILVQSERNKDGTGILLSDQIVKNLLCDRYKNKYLYFNLVFTFIWYKKS